MATTRYTVSMDPSSKARGSSTARHDARCFAISTNGAGAIPSTAIELPEDNLPIAYRTEQGFTAHCTIEDALESATFHELTGRVDLIFTSPPFLLNRKKRYGNRTGEDYVKWLSHLGSSLKSLLRPRGSLVVEIGNAWDRRCPTMSTVPLRALMTLADTAELQICQQFVCYNPARLPTPAQWVTVRRIRAKDAFTHVWWMSPSPDPKADNRRVLTPYSSAMRRLLRVGSSERWLRPSGHSVDHRSFSNDNGGAIPSNVLTFSNTSAHDDYIAYCRVNQLELHPARMPRGLAEFFIRFLTDTGDLVLDPFAGSNVTGAVAEQLSRRWISIEPNAGYVLGSRGRFTRASLDPPSV